MLCSMTKYNIEGGLDFYSELYGSLEQTDDETNVCLISNEPLTDRHVKMNCGHTFNYEPLYKDLVNHKTKFNNMESSAGSLGKNEIRCPYCRTKQTGIIPYYADFGLKQVEGVNIGFQPPQICCFIWENEFYDETIPGDKKMIKCSYMGSKTVLPGSIEIKFYCANHAKHLLTQYKLKQKEEKAALKASVKASAAANKALAKAVAKAEAKAVTKALADTKAVNKAVIKASENVVLASESWCVEILKSGDRKGHQCSFSKMDGHDQCKRHYNLLVKKNL